MAFNGRTTFQIPTTALSKPLRQNQKRENFIYQHENARAHNACLTVNFQVANIMFVPDRPPLSQDMSAIKLLIATLRVLLFDRL